MNFENGELIWYVHVFPDTEKFYVTKYKVVQESIMETINAPSLIVKNVDSTFKTEISLRDANVIPNTYNSHRIFKTSGESEDYVNSPELWHPLGYTIKEWDESAKADYLLGKLLDAAWAEDY